MGERAIYSVIENGKATQLYSQWGADLYTPFAVLHAVQNHRSELSRPSNVTATLLKVDYNCYFGSYHSGVEKIFERMNDQHAKEMLKDFGRTPATQMHVTLDLDTGIVRFEHNPMCYHDPQPSDFSVSLSDGLRCLAEAREEVMHEGKYYSTIIGERMESKLEQAVQESEQQETPQAPGLQM